MHKRKPKECIKGNHSLTIISIRHEPGTSLNDVSKSKNLQVLMMCRNNDNIYLQ